MNEGATVGANLAAHLKTTDDLVMKSLEKRQV